MREFRRVILSVVLAAVVLAGNGCFRARLVADYDPQIDAGITEFQRKAETFFVYLLRNAANEKAEYANNTVFYDGAKVEISLLKLRTGASAKNEISLKQLGLLLKILNDAEELHRDGKLKEVSIQSFRQNFEVSCQAILKFEMAKKRGENGNGKD